MKKALFLVVASIGLAGCVSQQQVDDVLASQRPVTTSEKTAIVNAARDVLYDAYSVRDAEISNAVPIGNGDLVAVCVKANSKNQMGGYVGRKTLSIRIVKGKAVSTLENALICVSPKMQYRHFPELENLRNL